MKRRIMRVCGAVAGLILLVGQASAQISTSDTTTAIPAQINARIDSLATQLQQAKETIDQQQALIDVMLQTQTQQPVAPAPAPQGGVSFPGQTAAPQQASNLLNPNISLIGDIRGHLGRDFEDHARAFMLHEAEIGIQAPIDPYARADAFIAISPEHGVEIEEMYITFLALPLGLQAKVGKFRSNFGKFNRTHPPETPFSDRPLFTETFFGEEGLAGTGASFSLLIPNSWVYLNLDAEVTSTPEESPSFGVFDPVEEEIITGGRRRDLMYLTRLGTFFDLSESTNLTLGGTYATGVYDPAGIMRTHLEGIDLTLRWQPLRRAIYHSLMWHTEALFSQREQPGGGRASTFGVFSYVDWQVLRRWHIGTRYDYTQFPDTSGADEQGVLGFLTFTPSEFSLLTWQVRGVRRADDGAWHGVGMMKITFNIGPHGAHPF